MGICLVSSSSAYLTASGIADLPLLFVADADTADSGVLGADLLDGVAGGVLDDDDEADDGEGGGMAALLVEVVVSR